MKKENSISMTPIQQLTSTVTSQKLGISITKSL